MSFELNGEMYLSHADVEARYGLNKTKLFNLRAANKLKSYKRVGFGNKSYWKESEIIELLSREPKASEPRSKIS